MIVSSSRAKLKFVLSRTLSFALFACGVVVLVSLVYGGSAHPVAIAFAIVCTAIFAWNATRAFDLMEEDRRDQR